MSPKKNDSNGSGKSTKKSKVRPIILDDFSAKVKRIFIELQNYNFFHGPSEIGNVDRRFVGRERLKEKLKALLTHDEIKSGSYLITGYRGMGKSSFVSKALHEISSCKKESKYASRHLRVLLILAVSLLPLVEDLLNAAFTFLGWEDGGRLSFHLFVLTSLAAILISSDPRFPRVNGPFRSAPTFAERIRPTWKGFCRWLMAILRTLYLEQESIPVQKARIYLQEIYIVIGIHLIAEACGWQKIHPFFILYLAVATISFLFPMLVSVAKHVSFPSGLRNREKGRQYWRGFSERHPFLTREGNLVPEAENGFASYCGYFLVWPTMFVEYFAVLTFRFYRGIDTTVKKYINYSHRYYIRVNLGYDELKEIDILRLIAKSITTKYEEARRFRFPISYPGLSWRVVKLIVVFVIAQTVYTSSPIRGLNQSLKEESHFISVFPSQGAHFLDDRNAFLQFVRPHKDSANPPLFADIGAFLDTLKTNTRKELPDKAKLFEKQTHNPIYQHIRATFIYIDLFANAIYGKFRRGLGYLLKAEYDDTFQIAYILPIIPDYFAVFYFLLVWQVLNLLGHFRLFGIVTHAHVSRKLRRLNDSIDAQVTLEKGGQVNIPKFYLGLFKREQHLYQVAEVREIEKQIIEILDEIDQIPRITIKPEFIYIFDELDKIEPHKNVNIVEKEEQDETHVVHDYEMIFSTEEARKRQHTILKILSNLKRLLTTAKAKFIFIAGREMYDASLADVSDRNFFIGSIFHEVINVNSFLTETSDRQLPDITSMTEAYLCRFLLPAHFHDGECNLRTFHHYLIREGILDEEEDDLSPSQKNLIRLTRQRVIVTLQQFIVYLTYRSNGAPKKLTRFFEDYIVSVPREQLKNNCNNLVIGKNDRNLYLEFGFYDQYTFGMINYLANPFFQSINKSIKDFGDKLLVSTSFLVDHLYKFHGSGFAWRNLELIPEIVDINKAPELRDLINNILRYLSQTHIEAYQGGVFEYKFRRKVVEEISFLSKVSERESAAFNFTLDESLSIKRHHKRMLRELEAVYRPTFSAGKEPEYIHSIGFIHMNIGDLHYYDEEYNEAIIEYLEAIQMFRPNLEANLSVDRFLLLLRNMLKLGLAFEKKKTLNSAFASFSKVSSLVTRHRDKAVEALNSKASEVWPVGDPNNGKDIGEGAHGFTGLGGNPSETLETSDRIEDVFRFGTLMAGFKIVYQPFIARLYILEKIQPGGVTLVDLERLLFEIDHLQEPLTLEVSEVLLADLYIEIGNLLYFKNGLVPPLTEPPKEIPAAPAIDKQTAQDQSSAVTADDPNGTERIYCQRPTAICSPNPGISDFILKKGNKTPCHACHFYHSSLAIMCRHYLEDTNYNGDGESNGGSAMLATLFYALGSYAFARQETAVVLRIGKLLSNIGDTFISCATERERFDSTFMSTFLKHFTREPTPHNKRLELFNQLVGRVTRRRGSGYPSEFQKTEEAILCFYLAALYLKIGGDHKGYAFELTKVLYLLRDFLNGGKYSGKVGNKALKKIDPEKVQHLVSKIIKSQYRAYGNTTRSEVDRYQGIFEDAYLARVDKKFVNLNQVSLISELREVIVLYQEIRMRLESIHGKKEIPARMELVNPYTVVNSAFNRILELRYKALVNYRLFKKLGFTLKASPGEECKGHNEISNRHYAEVQWKEETDVDPNFIGFGNELPDAHELFEFLVTDSIFCLNEMIGFYSIYGVSYMANHTMIASTHHKLGFWCQQYYCYLINRTNSEGKPRIHTRLEELIGSSRVTTLSPKYHYEMALTHYRRARDVHREGKTYVDITGEMSYLNGDYNDGLSHFCAAVERHRINIGITKEKIDQVRQECEKSTLYDIEQYLANYAPNKLKSKLDTAENDAGTRNHAADIK